MSYKIKEIMDWWKKFNNTDIEIQTENNLFYIKLNDEQLPHLLGLQYTANTSNKYTGRKLYNFCYGKNDEEIFELIRKNHGDMEESVRDRVSTFRYFMENLDRGVLHENMHFTTDIKSEHFIVEYQKDSKNSNKTKLLHLGLLTVAGGDEIVEYGVIDKNLETYIIKQNERYIKNSPIIEVVKSIEKYNEQGELEPFSFDENKRQQLLAEYYKNKIKEIPTYNINEKIEEYLNSKNEESVLEDDFDFVRKI